MNRIALASSFLLGLSVLAGCDTAAPTDAGPDSGGLDAPPPVDGGPSDVPDGTVSMDVGRLDAADVGARDGGRDAGSDVPFDAGPDVSREVTDALDLFCDPPAYGACTAPWACGCDTFGSGPPADVPSCVMRNRGTCDIDLRVQLTPFFARGGVTIDATLLDACVAELRRTYDLCLPPADELPLVCRDAIVVGMPVGAPCEFPGFRCADGEGVCGRSCEAAPGAGESCTSFCGPGLACVSGTCTDPVAAGGACSDHEDCAGPELCVGGICGAPVASGGSCTDEARCATGLICDRGTCGPRLEPSCTIGSAECGAATDCTFASRRVCVAARSTGERCNDDSECQVGNLCDFRTFPGMCAPLPSIGEPCNSRCQLGLRCFDMFTGSAMCSSPRRLGERCDDVFSRDGSVCEDGLSCRSGMCSPTPGIGENCSGDGRCQEGLVCLFDSTTFEQLCQPRVPEGASCQGDQECLDNLFCDFSMRFPGVCRPIPREGQECTFQCADELDCRFFAPLGESYCIPPGSIGGECSSRCVPGAFCTDDSTRGSCVPEICGFVSGGRGPGPTPF